MKKRKKFFVKLIRNIETIKTVTLILLMVFCVYLGILIFQYQTISDGRNLSFFIWNNFEYMFEDTHKTETSTQYREIFSAAALPLYAVADNGEGREIFYRETDGYEDICEIVDNYIFSVYTGENRAVVEKVTEDSEWMEDLNSGFIYEKLPIDVNTALLTGTAYESNIISKSIEGYDEIIITANTDGQKYKNSTVIYLFSSKRDDKLRIILDKSPLTVLDIVENQTYGAEGDCVFVFEFDNEEFSDYDVVREINRLNESGKVNIDSMLVLPISTIKTPVISVSSSNKYSEEIHVMENSEDIERLLSLFEYDLNGMRQYSDNNDNIVFVDENKTLTLSPGGTISYINSSDLSEEDDGGSRNSTVRGTADLCKIIYDVLRIFVNDNYECSVGITEINSYYDDEKNLISDIEFDYMIEGNKVNCYLGEETGNNLNVGHFITARLCNGKINSLEIQIKKLETVDEDGFNESAFTALNRYINENMDNSECIKIYDIGLEYRYNSSSTKIHTTWTIKGDITR